MSSGKGLWSEKIHDVHLELFVEKVWNSAACCAHVRTCDETSCYIRDEPSARVKIGKWIIFASVHVALTFAWHTAEPWPNPLRAVLLNRAVYGAVYHSAAPYTPLYTTSEQICTSLHRAGKKEQ